MTNNVVNIQAKAKNLKGVLRHNCPNNYENVLVLTSTTQHVKLVKSNNNYREITTQHTSKNGINAHRGKLSFSKIKEKRSESIGRFLNDSNSLQTLTQLRPFFEIASQI